MFENNSKKTPLIHSCFLDTLIEFESMEEEDMSHSRIQLKNNSSLMEFPMDRLVRANEACIKDLFSLEGTL